MKFTATILIVLTLAGGAFAKKHEHNDADFTITGTLMEQNQISLGTSCDKDDCSPVVRTRYTVVSDGVAYVLAPVPGSAFKHPYGIGYKDSVLTSQRPGTAVKMLREKSHDMYVKVSGGDRESRYEIVGTSLVTK